MSTPTANTSVETTTSSGLGIGMIVGGIVFAMIIIGIIIYVFKRRQNAGVNAAPSMPTPSGPNNGLPGPTNVNINSTRLSNGNGNRRPQ